MLVKKRELFWRGIIQRGGIQGVVQVKVGMPKFGSVRIFQNFAERGTGLYVRSGKFAERRTGPLVHVREGSGLGSAGV